MVHLKVSSLQNCTKVYTQKNMFKKYNHIQKSSQSLVSNLQSLKWNHEILHKNALMHEMRVLALVATMNLKCILKYSEI